MEYLWVLRYRDRQNYSSLYFVFVWGWEGDTLDKARGGC